ncbi:MAG: ribosome small subunit-dependent GTPase A [Planctomycetes bacterium]|nr:ribosome small subunit-dependent GTPase A [Planctomycetota bacterium]
MPSPSLQGLVLRVDAKICHVEVDGEVRQLPLAGKLFETRTHEKRPLTVGDLVVLDATGQSIDALQPRTSQLHRRAAGEGSPRSQVLAANITHVIVTASVTEPPFQPVLTDSVLAAARREQIPATLVLTKQDRDPALAAELAAIYERIGVAVLITSTHPDHETTATLESLGRLLHANRSVLTGLSGAGKSTLLNRLVPGANLRTGSLSRIRQGKHTTSHTELIPLPGGGYVLDTPGVRSFALFCVGPQELQFLFPEIGERLPRCEFRSCLHENEANCAVLAAVEGGDIAASRYASYRLLLADARGEDKADAEAERPQQRRRRPR